MTQPWPGVCHRLATGMQGYGSAKTGADHLWRLDDVVAGVERWTCPYCRSRSVRYRDRTAVITQDVKVGEPWPEREAAA